MPPRAYGAAGGQGDEQVRFQTQDPLDTERALLRVADVGERRETWDCRLIPDPAHPTIVLPLIVVRTDHPIPAYGSGNGLEVEAYNDAFGGCLQRHPTPR